MAWQHAFSADIFSPLAFVNSPNIRAGYSSPQDLRQRGSENFTESRFWWPVIFPHFGLFRIVNEATYEGFYSDPASAPAPRPRLPGFEAPMAVAAVASVGAIVLLVRRRAN